jgi:hypothetical protein
MSPVLDEPKFQRPHIMKTISGNIRCINITSIVFHHQQSPLHTTSKAVYKSINQTYKKHLNHVATVMWLFLEEALLNGKCKTIQ